MRRRLAGDVARSLLPLTLVALWCLVVMPDLSAGMVAPFVIVYWLLVAAGLAEVWEATSRTAGGRAGAVALSIALVVLQIAAASARRSMSGPVDGHERLTVAMMTAIVGALPRGAGLVEEDAATDLLTRALPSRLRTPDRFHFVRRDGTAVAHALGNAPVFALPRSQRVLQHMGFELADAPSAGFNGLAEIRAQHACTPELGNAPIPLPLLTGRQAFALVAGHERSQDRIVIVLVGDTPVSVSTVNWPPAAMRGIQGRTFDLTVAADQTDLGEELRSYGLSSWSAQGVRYVTRIEAWRTPGAPLVLPITLGGAVAGGTARRLGASSDQQLRLCPSIPYDVQPLAR
jgi:hypothetical protein